MLHRDLYHRHSGNRYSVIILVAMVMLNATMYYIYYTILSHIDIQIPDVLTRTRLARASAGRRGPGTFPAAGAAGAASPIEFRSVLIMRIGKDLPASISEVSH